MINLLVKNGKSGTNNMIIPLYILVIKTFSYSSLIPSFIRNKIFLYVVILRSKTVFQPHDVNDDILNIINISLEKML